MTAATADIHTAHDAARMSVNDLADLMSSVNEVTDRLLSTHESLKQQVASLQDELAEANAQLRRTKSLAALGEMAAGIAHEVRNPLASILLYVQMLADDLAERPEQRGLCTRIGRAVERLDAIVNDVLSFARDLRVRPETIEVADLIDRGAASCEAIVAAHRIDIACEIEGRSLRVAADPGLVVQALANVIRNGIEAMIEHEEPRPGDASRLVRITGARARRRLADGSRAQRIVIAVEDSGPGIPPDVVRRMFNPFFTTRRTGTGLGLAIVHRIIDAHGGEVSVANRESGGARIELCLPPEGVAPKNRRPAGGAATPPARPEAGHSNELEEASLTRAVMRRIRNGATT